VTWVERERLTSEEVKRSGQVEINQTKKKQCSSQDLQVEGVLVREHKSKSGAEHLYS
jgi:hypothetical protein